MRKAHLLHLVPFVRRMQTARVCRIVCNLQVLVWVLQHSPYMPMVHSPNTARIGQQVFIVQYGTTSNTHQGSCNARTTYSPMVSLS